MTLYQGRIATKHSGLMDEINRSLPVDIRLLPYDVLTNKAWCDELHRLGILNADERRSIFAALDDVARLAREGAFEKLPDDEDVHTLVERLVTERADEAGAKIHTGRSRNDQVVCDLRMYACDRTAELSELVIRLIQTLQKLGAEHAETLLAGETHLQPAQVITLGHFLLSLGFALARDLGRLRDSFARANLCPLGAGALAGSGFPVDRRRLAEALGFDGVCGNTLDAVSDRDFVQEIVFACATICLHLSRCAEQFVIWSNPAFGYVRFADDWSTGSSMMPQKRNPDAMELIRAKAARVVGDATSLSALIKGLPLSYVKDLQEDKPPFFDALDSTSLCLRVFDAALASARFDAARMKDALTGDLLATDLADLLVEAGLPFRVAHEKVGRLVSGLEQQSRSLSNVGPEELRRQFSELREKRLPLNFADAPARRRVTGGADPARIAEQIEMLNSVIAEKSLRRRLTE
jgi:argininosuccinate lyase